MQKKLIALAMASAFAAPAFAATSNVDIYGVFNMSVERIDSGRTGVDKSTSVNNNNSRIGFKGTEDLGGGLAAVWQVESSIAADQGSGSLAARNTFVGLKGGFGTVLLGKIDTPMKGLGRAVDNFGDGIADSRNILGTTLVGANAWDARTNNTIAYVTPDFSGLSAVLAYVTDTSASGTTAAPISSITTCASSLDCNKRDAWSGAVNYNNGPLMLGAGYEKHNSSAAGVDLSAHIWRAVAGYSFGGAKLGALYEKASGDALANGDSLMDRKAWGVFGNYAIGAVTLKANYLKADEQGNIANSGAKQYTLGADYALSKRTTAYAFYAKVKNDTNAGYGLGAAGTSNTFIPGSNAGTTAAPFPYAGVDPSVFGIGMKHSF
ncbi:porin [Thiobacillus sedimenti]|uniref:Porin n=1 Tax=Thiobacillus sedimenti TaxID=3110231 RepID=A0ABZ1CK79_9PROT|nr:porin [Thiobacillus sp. SCUT-2]WRS39774.1 porin [Thiobacillus sp. SCUT-2]